MGFFIDGRLSRAAILAKATNRLVEVDSGESGWLYHPGDGAHIIAKASRRTVPEVETDGDTADSRKKSKTVNS